MTRTGQARELARAWVLCTLAVGALAVLWLVSTQVQSIRAISPWSVDPYDAVLSVATLVLPFVWAVTTIRVLRWRVADAIPPGAGRTIARGLAVVLALVWAPVMACVAALAAHARHGVWGPWLGWLEGLVAVTGLAALVASLDLARLRPARDSARAPGGPGRWAEPDALDDVEAVLDRTAATMARSMPRLGRLLTQSASAVAALASSTWGPRRHRFAWCLGLALGFGASLAAWQGISEGAPAHWFVPAIFTSAGAAIVVLSYACLGTYLRLIRPEGRPRRT